MTSVGVWLVLFIPAHFIGGLGTPSRDFRRVGANHGADQHNRAGS
jgi:hypothetical protein